MSFSLAYRIAIIQKTSVFVISEQLLPSNKIIVLSHSGLGTRI